jgi:Cft2 family RNA processing exonuclease
MLSYNRGVVYHDEGTKIVFDPERKIKAGMAFISHAHSDHAKKHSVPAIMTPETQAISGLQGTVLPYGKHCVDGVDIELADAGHVLGSAQARLGDFAYTGDFRLAESPLFHGAQPLECDDLVIESTFGRPEYSFPAPAEAAAALGAWVKRNNDAGRIVVVGGYALGKSQELTRALNDAGITPIVHHKIHAINEIYARHGKNLGNYLCSDSPEAKEAMRSPFVVQMPQHAVRDELIRGLAMQYHRQVVACIATGWATMLPQSTTSRAFPLSDHADYKQLVDYVEQAHPKRVHTVHGYAAEFARQLKRMGWNAEPLQKRLGTLEQFL